MDEVNNQSAATTPEPVAPEVGYKDDDLVYVDPDTRTVVGRVEWNKAGNPKSLPMKIVEEEVEDEAPKDGKPAPAGKVKRPMRRRIQRQRYYPWGTYRAMKRLYKIEGKQKSEPSQKTLDEVMEKALKEPFWD